MNVLKALYGATEEASVQSVKRIYKDLQMEEEYKKESDAMHTAIVQMIDESKNVPKAIFKQLLEMIHNRSK
jgi:hypothetical protein